MAGSQKEIGDCCAKKAIQTADFSALVCRLPPTLQAVESPQPDAEAAAAPSLANISHFIQKLVEKLYSGVFSADPRHILLFITEHIMVVRTHTGRGGKVLKEEVSVRHC